VRLADLQEQVGNWSHQNFGSDPKHRLHPLLGMIEETGELSEAVWSSIAFSDDTDEACVRDLLMCQVLLGRIVHAVLKGLQNIRGHGAQDVERLLWAADKMAEFMIRLCHDYGVPNGIETDETVTFSKEVDAVADIEIYMADYCRRNGISLELAVIETWRKVSQRNWKADPAKGEVAG
jgi:hypothetical protein